MAKANTQLFKRLVQPCMEANIIMIFINHITAKVETGVTPTQASIQLFKTKRKFTWWISTSIP